MTNYVSGTGCGKYEIRFETDNREYYERVQQVIRECIDGAPAKGLAAENAVLKAKLSKAKDVEGLLRGVVQEFVKSSDVCGYEVCANFGEACDQCSAHSNYKCLV